jgi:glucosamine-6-phosphate deaminase
MQVMLTEDYAAMSRLAAQCMVSAIRANPSASMVVAVGNTPIGSYRELAMLRKQGACDTAHLRVFQLDEYLGITSDDPRSLYRWLKRDCLDPLTLREEQVVRLRSDTTDPVATCRQYDAAVERAGGFDIVVLGLGPNGHLGFNEPPSDPSSSTRVIDLTEESLVSNAVYWGGQARVPRRAMTCGMVQLLAARQILLLVSGTHKRNILQRAITGPVTSSVPASYLQRGKNVIVITDTSAWYGQKVSNEGEK